MFRYTLGFENLSYPGWKEGMPFRLIKAAYGYVTIGAGTGFAEKRGKSEKFYSIFFKKSREWKGQSPFPGTHFPYFRSCPQL